jgi:glyceraldehyde-3-phosphate dehydrogenase (NAD(P))
VLLDAAPGGIGAVNKNTYENILKKAIFQGGEKDDIAECFFTAMRTMKKASVRNF